MPPKTIPAHSIAGAQVTSTVTKKQFCRFGCNILEKEDIFNYIPNKWL